MPEPTRPEPFVLWLTWHCRTCGWETTMAAPGYAGDGWDHFEQPDNRRCGPLCAARATPAAIANEKRRVLAAVPGTERNPT